MIIQTLLLALWTAGTAIVWFAIGRAIGQCERRKK
jgi:hypothetical protein